MPRRTSELRPPTPLGMRLRVALSRWRLDRELADGRPAIDSNERALRARQLVDSGTRLQLARRLRDIVADAENPRAALGSAIPVRRTEVIRCREALLGVADRLEQPEPMSASAVARVMVVLTDGAGPLYNPAARPALGEAIWWVADGLASSAPA